LSVKRVVGSSPLPLGALGLLLAVAAVAAPTFPALAASATGTHRILAVGAEDEYANVIGQIGGRYVQVSAIMNNPNTDPHTFEASPRVAEVVSAAQLVVQNGLGYDSFMNQIEAASPSRLRKVIDVQKLLGLPSNSSNPHLWYDACGRPVGGRRSGPAGSRPRRLLPGRGRQLRPITGPVVDGDCPAQGQVPPRPGRDHRTGG
jgi:zinc/manganese transport system substrate-binding protein